LTGRKAAVANSVFEGDAILDDAERKQVGKAKTALHWVLPISMKPGIELTDV
jgi:hypothetical protein